MYSAAEHWLSSTIVSNVTTMMMMMMIYNDVSNLLM